jgi:hypothetical protein
VDIDFGGVDSLTAVVFLHKFGGET